jgi:hypothetical protein
MPVRKYYWLYKRLAEQGGNSSHYEKIVKCSREHYRRQMADPEKREVERQKKHEYYMKNREEKKKYQRENYQRKKALKHG